MEEESVWLNHLKRLAAVVIGLVLGLVAAYLVVAVSAGARKGSPLKIDPKAVPGNPLESSVFSAAQAPAQSGAAIFHQRCARCHGEKGRGDGPLARLLTTQPRDLVKGPYWLRSTPWGTAPSEEDLRRVIERGIPGTAMPGFEYAFKDVKADADGRDVVERLLALLQKRSRYLRTLGKSLEVPEQASGEGWELEAGQAVYKALACAECHGHDGQSVGAKGKALKDWRGRPLHIPDLSEPWDFRRGGQTEEIWQTLELGLEPKYMPSLTKRSSKADRLALAIYVHSLGRAFLDPAEMRSARENRGLLRQGANMVKLMSCERCHTPQDARGLPLEQFRFAGGQKIHTAAGDFVAPNLTPDPESALAKLDDSVIARAISTGETHDGRDIDPMAMPWTWYSMLTSSDLAAIVAHLRQLPARKSLASASDATGSGQSIDAEMPGRFGQLFGANTWLLHDFSQADSALNSGREAKSDPALNSGREAKSDPVDKQDKKTVNDEVKTAEAPAQNKAQDSAREPAVDSAASKAGADNQQGQKAASGIAALQARQDAAALKLKEAAAEYAASKAALDAAQQALKKPAKKNKKSKKRRSKRRRSKRRRRR